ncbi:MAG: hypothetical protein CM15mP128_3230 [Methanobacteriota archaeon]|nr:MAG: hypothetical protein CM15mP128_3230 [Euryarchaeota archaeon]
MLTPPFVLHRPTSVEEACAIAAELAAADRPFDWVAGGTDLLPNYKWHLNPKGDVISSRTLARRRCFGSESRGLHGPIA